MFRKMMLGMYLAAMFYLVFLFPSTALATGQPLHIAAQAAGTTVEATETGGGATFVFVPDTITVKTGDKVIFKNTGKIPHTATADDGSWDSGNLAAGATFDTPALTKPRTITYKCVYHVSLGMIGKIVVTGAAVAGSAATTSASPSVSASPSPSLTGAAQFGISPAPVPTAPPSQKYFPKIAGAVVVLALLGIVLGYVKTARKLADKS